MISERDDENILVSQPCSKGPYVDGSFCQNKSAISYL